MIVKPLRAGVLLSLCMFSTAIAQSPPSYTITPIGLSGPDYTYTASDGYTDQYSEAYGLDASGQADGYSSRFDFVGDSLGQDIWSENNGVTQPVGLTGNNYSYSRANGIYQYSSLSRFGLTIDPAGQFFGETSRYTPAGGTLGEDAWFYNGNSTEQIGLAGPGYSCSISGGVYEYDEEDDMNNAGQAIGSSERYNAAGNFLGDDTWFFSGTASTAIGLTGGVYDYNYTGAGGGMVQTSYPDVINDAGQAIGTSGRFGPTGANLGSDSWFFNGSTTHQIGLLGANYSYVIAGSGIFEQIIVGRLSATGDVAGVSMRYNSQGTNLGQDTWIFNGISTQQIGLTGNQYQYTLASSGGGIYESSGVVGLNNSGQTVGFSNRYNSAGSVLGTDSWFFDGSTTRQIGLTGAGYTYTSTQPGGGAYEASGPYAVINKAGQIASGSSRFADNGALLGHDAWFFNGSTTKAIGLTGPGYSYSIAMGTYQFGRTMAINNNPDTQVLGLSNRYDSSGNSLGQAAWFFDSATGLTTPLVFSIRADGYGYTDPIALTDTGVVLGYYDLFSSPTSSTIDAFYWSEQYGFYDLGTLVNGGLAADGWAQLTDADFAAGELSDGSPQFLVGYGVLANSEGTSVFLMNAVPEPGLWGSVITGLIIAGRRKRA